jgi:hypothetical protein
MLLEVAMARHGSWRHVVDVVPMHASISHMKGLILLDTS